MKSERGYFSVYPALADCGLRLFYPVLSGSMVLTEPLNPKNLQKTVALHPSIATVRVRFLTEAGPFKH
jgi:hypothetical protein